MLRAMLFILTYLVVDHFQLSLANLPYNMHADPCGIRPDQNWNEACNCGTACIGRQYWAAPYSNLIHVAYNRPAYVSSIWACDQSPELSCYQCGKNSAACNVVTFNSWPDWLATGCDVFTVNCLHTADDYAWWYVNLQRPYTLLFIMIRPRNPYGSDDTELSIYRMANVIIFVDSRTCYAFFSYRYRSSITRASDWNHHIYCSEAMTGQYVRVQKANYEMSYKQAGGQNLHFCEIYVWVCPSGTFGGTTYTSSGVSWSSKAPFTCTSTCPGHCDYYCDNHVGCLGGNPSTLMDRSGNVAQYSTTTYTYGSYSKAPSQALDQVVTPRDQNWYQSAWSSGQNHFLRVSLGNVYLIVGAAVYTITSQENYMMETEVRVGRALTSSERTTRWVEKEVKCWRDTGSLGSGVSRTCDLCSSSVSNCPRAEYGTVIENGGASYLYIVQFAVFGIPVKETLVTTACPSACKLTFCGYKLVCEMSTSTAGVCKSPIGNVCTTDDHCVQAGKCESQICRLRHDSGCQDFQNPDLCARGLKCSGSQGYRCKLMANEGPCSVGDDCLQDPADDTRMTCDYMSICRVRVGGTCTTPRECVAGADCVSGACTCNAAVSIPSGLYCHPIIYDKECNTTLSNSSSECPLQNGECRNTTDQCCCLAGYTLVHRDFSCKVAAGGPCNEAANLLCGEGLICEENVCRIKLGDVCDETKADECKAKTWCDDKQKICLTKEGESCSEDKECRSGTNCVENSQGSKKCLFVPAHECTGQNQCRPGFECAKKAISDAIRKCYVALCSVCDEKDVLLQCPMNQFCDRDHRGEKHCKIDIVKECASHDQCPEYAMCGTGQNNKCYWRVGAECNNTQSPDPCGPNRKCDSDGVCRIAKGQPCKAFPGYCVLGTYCDVGSNMCKCLDITNAASSNRCTLKSQIEGEVPTLWTTSCTPPPPPENTTSHPEGTTTNNSAAPAVCRDAGNAVCDPQTNTCQCTNGYSPAVDFICKPVIGGPCSPANTTDDLPDPDPNNPQTSEECVMGAVCDEGACRITISQPCFGKNKESCMSGTLCSVDGVCKANLGVSCAGGLEQFCFDGLVCDAFKMCKVPQGGECVYNKTCVAGSECVNNTCTCNTEVTKQSNAGDCGGAKDGYAFGRCQEQSSCLDGNAHCNETQGTLCICNEEFEASSLDLSCKVAVDNPCSKDDDCAPGRVCDPKKRVCKPAVGFFCKKMKDSGEACETGAECVDGTCKISLGRSCAGELKKFHCIIGSKCDDMVSQCKRPVGTECDKEGQNQCETGAICTSATKKGKKEDYKCTCHPKTEEKSGICAPKPGHAKGECMLGNKCIDGARCVTDDIPKVCQCEGRYPFNPDDYTCSGYQPSKTSDQPSLGSAFTVVFSILGALLLVGMLLAVVYRRKGSEKKDALQEEFDERLEKIKELGESIDKAGESQDKGPTTMALSPFGNMAGGNPEGSTGDNPDGSAAKEDESEDEDEV